MLAKLLPQLNDLLKEYGQYYLPVEGLVVYHESAECCMETIKVTGPLDAMTRISQHVCGKEVNGWGHMRMDGYK